MEFHKQDNFVLLKMNHMGIAMVAGDPSSKNMDVIHFSMDHSYKPTFESNIASGRVIEE